MEEYGYTEEVTVEAEDKYFSSLDEIIAGLTEAGMAGSDTGRAVCEFNGYEIVYGVSIGAEAMKKAVETVYMENTERYLEWRENHPELDILEINPV